MERFDMMTNEQATEHPVYVQPEMVSYSDDLIWEVMGPARTLYACDPSSPTCP